MKELALDIKQQAAATECISVFNIAALMRLNRYMTPSTNPKRVCQCVSVKLSRATKKPTSICTYLQRPAKMTSDQDRPIQIKSKIICTIGPKTQSYLPIDAASTCSENS
jgi:hypothetical protein